MAFKRSAVRARLSPPDTLKRLDFFGDQAFLFPSKMNIGMMLAASTAVQASSPLLKKAVSTFSDRESGLFLLPYLYFSAAHSSSK